MTWLTALTWLIGLVGLARRRTRKRHARCASTTTTPAPQQRRSSASTGWSSSRLPWPGNPARPIDDTNLGKYFFEVDRPRVESRRLLARIRVDLRRVGDDRRGASRWRGRSRSRCASRCPPAPVQVVVKKRDAANAFQRGLVDARRSGRSVRSTRRAPPSPGPVVELLKNGDPADKVDLLILGDGYTAAERPKFEKDARRLVEILFATSPFKERSRTSTSGGCVRPRPSPGVSRPSTGNHRRSPVGATYDAFGSERYVLTFDNRQFRDVAVVCALRRRRDHRQRPHLRRWRHFRSLRDRGRRQPVGALCLRSRVRAPLRRSGRRVLHLSGGLPARATTRSSRGRRTPRRSRIRRH